MSAVAAIAAWLLTAVAAFGGNGITSVLALGVALLASAAHVLRPRNTLSRHDHLVVDGWYRFDRELRRQRRHGRALSLGRLTLDGPAGLGVDAVAPRLGAVLRGDDFVFVDDGLVYFVLPEEDATSAEVPIDRLSGVLHDLGAAGTTAVVAYPGDGLTLSALLLRLEATQSRRVGALPAASDPGSQADETAAPTVEVPALMPQQATSIDLRRMAPLQPEPGQGT